MKARIIIMFLVTTFITSCFHAYTPDILVTVETETAKGVGIKLGPCNELLTNGCPVLTVAHLCNPIVISDAIARQEEQTKFDEEPWDPRPTVILVDMMGRSKALCMAEVHDITTGKMYRAVGTLVNFASDLMILTPLNIVLSNPEFAIMDELKIAYPEFSEDLVTLSVSPTNHIGIAIFSKRGIGSVLIGMIDNDQQDYIQTQLNIGPGGSGSPVFTKDMQELVGIYAIEIIDGDDRANFRASFLIKAEKADRLIKYYNNMVRVANDNKPRWPHCIGKNHLCDVVLGTKSFVEFHRNRQAEETISK